MVWLCVAVVVVFLRFTVLLKTMCFSSWVGSVFLQVCWWGLLLLRCCTKDLFLSVLQEGNCYLYHGMLQYGNVSWYCATLVICLCYTVISLWLVFFLQCCKICGMFLLALQDGGVFQVSLRVKPAAKANARGQLLIIKIPDKSAQKYYNVRPSHTWLTLAEVKHLLATVNYEGGGEYIIMWCFLQ